MGIDTAAVLAVLSLLALGLVIIGMALLRRSAGAPAPAGDPAIPLLQQQLSRITEQLASLASQVPREVGASLAQLTGQVTARLSENSQSLQQAAADTSRLIADVNVRLGELGRSSQQILDLGQEVRSLQQIFQAPKIRGGLGELSLGSLLQQIFPADHFSLQHAFQNGEIVDAVVKLPGGLVPIDSKFPLAGFRSVLDSTSDELRLKARKAFARDVRRHVEDIAVKYIRPSEGTLDFALMYVPAENVYYETIIRDPCEDGDDSISSAALKRRVIPVSPNSLYAYLQAIAFGLMGLRIEDRAREILRNLQQLHGDFGVFQEAHALGQKHLKNAQAAFSDAGERAGRIAFQVEQFVRVAESKPLPPSVRTLP
jgi:DNA recombination protein RmuC